MLDEKTVEYGDVIKWDYHNDDGQYIVGRVLGFLTKEASINLTNTSLAAVVDVMFSEGDRPENMISYWDSYFKEKGIPPMKSGNLSKRSNYQNSRLSILSLTFCEQFFNWTAKFSFKENGCCPKCGHRGEWISLALVCNWHGKFI